MDKVWISQVDTAKILGVTPPTVKKYREEGLIPKGFIKKVRRGRRVRVFIHRHAVMDLKKKLEAIGEE